MWARNEIKKNKKKENSHIYFTTRISQYFNHIGNVCFWDERFWSIMCFIL